MTTDKLLDEEGPTVTQTVFSASFAAANDLVKAAACEKDEQQPDEGVLSKVALLIQSIIDPGRPANIDVRHTLEMISITAGPRTLDIEEVDRMIGFHAKP